MRDFLIEAKEIAQIADKKGLECETDFRLAELYIQISIAEELKKLNSPTGRLAYISACLNDIAREMGE